MRSVIDLV